MIVFLSLVDMTSTYTPPTPGSKIIIVGAGALGLSTAFALSEKKAYEIHVFDRDQIPVPDAASTGKVSPVDIQ